MKVKWADHADWKRALFQISPINRSAQRVVFAPHYIFLFSFFGSILTLASVPFILIAILLASSSSTSSWIFYLVDKFNILCLIETSPVYSLNISWELAAVPFISSYKQREKKIKCCVCFVNIMWVNYELRQLVVVDIKRARKERKKETDNVICRANIHLYSFNSKCSQH
jgi:hypothetical protein